MIKRFLHILALSALVCSCVKEGPLPAPASPCDEIGVERDGKVTLGFNVDLGDGMGEGTKALGETPTIQNIYVAVFDATGYKLSEYVKADPITTGPENNHKYQFTIQLKVSNNPRTLHFIANGPKALRFGTEQEVIGELYSSYDADETDEYSRKDAYWQRLVFPKIAPRPEGTDDGSQAWQDYNAMVTALSNLKLIRNFSKVTLSKASAVANFVIEGMWFVNYPDRGSIAPYNRNTGKFGTDLSDLPGGIKRTKNYLDYENMAEVEDPAQGNYQGFTLASTKFITPETFDNSNMIAVATEGPDKGKAFGYVFEREKALTSPMYLIVMGKYNGSSSSSYYKIAMQDQNGNHYAMLRNFNYNVQILSVNSAGYSSVADALAGPPTGDISMNIDYKDLPNISDGNARITVSATKLLIVGEDGEETTADFWYKYEPDIAGHKFTGIHNDVAKGDEEMDGEDTWNHKHPHVLITYEGTEGSTGAVVSSLSVATTDVGGNRHVTINTTAASATPKTQTITIEGRRWDGSRYQTITRTVQLVLRDALEMSISASPDTGVEPDPEHPLDPEKTYDAAHILARTGQPVVVHIGIDQDLPSSMFPLYFKVAPRVKSLTPDNDYASVQELPVRYGTDPSGHPTYWFEKAISWAEYEGAPIVNGKKQFDVYFKTILAANETKIDISNEYFVPGTAMVKNYTPQTFSSLAFGGSTHKVAQSETFSYTMSALPADGKVNIAMKGIEPASLTGFTFLGKDSDGFWIYEREVTSTSDNFSIVPYLQGTAEIKLSAYLFTDASTSAFVIPSEIPVGTVIFNDTFGTSNVAIVNYKGSGIKSDYNKSGVSYSLSGSGTNTSIANNKAANMEDSYIRYNYTNWSNTNTVTISNIQAYGAKKFTLTFAGYISNSNVNGTYSVNDGTAQSISSSASNSFDFELGTSEETITISFVITHSSNYSSAQLGIDNVKLTVRE